MKISHDHFFISQSSQLFTNMTFMRKSWVSPEKQCNFKALVTGISTVTGRDTVQEFHFLVNSSQGARF